MRTIREKMKSVIAIIPANKGLKHLMVFVCALLTAIGLKNLLVVLVGRSAGIGISLRLSVTDTLLWVCAAGFLVYQIWAGKRAAQLAVPTENRANADSQARIVTSRAA